MPLFSSFHSVFAIRAIHWCHLLILASLQQTVDASLVLIALHLHSRLFPFHLQSSIKLLQSNKKELNMLNPTEKKINFEECFVIENEKKWTKNPGERIGTFMYSSGRHLVSEGEKRVMTDFFKLLAWQLPFFIRFYAPFFNTIYLVDQKCINITRHVMALLFRTLDGAWARKVYDTLLPSTQDEVNEWRTSKKKIII